MRWVVWNGGERWAMSNEWIKISGVRTATPNTVYTQQGAKPACQQDITVNFSHLLLAQLPRTQFTHSKAPNPHARRHQHKICASPIGTATPNTVYTQQGAKPARQEDITAIFLHLLLAGLPPTTFPHSKFIYTQQAAKPACQQDINTQFSHLLVAQLPRTQFTHSKAPNPLSTCPSLEALNTAPATQTEAAGQRRPGAPQPFLEALSTAPATQRGAAGQRRPGAPQPFLEALSTAPVTQTGAAGQRRAGAPQPFLEALSTAPATQTGAAG